MLTIKNNITANNAARQLGVTYSALGKSVERLSSGQRINSSGDDAASLAVRELMRADIAVLRQGARNALDAISFFQTMDGAMNTIDDILVRLKELAEQAATDTYSPAQRTIINNEFQELTGEIDRIAETAEFNSIKMLNCASDSVDFHFATGPALNVSTVDVRSAALGIDNGSVSLDGGSGSSARAALGAINTAIERKDSARTYLGTIWSRLENTQQVLQIQAENLLASESRISDVDVATEMAALTRGLVLSRAGVSMLSQANMLPRMALALLHE